MKNLVFAKAGVLPEGLAEDGDGFTRRMTSKRIGEVSEAALALKARTMGFMVAKPWGDSELYDLILPATHLLAKREKNGAPGFLRGASDCPCYG